MKENKCICNSSDFETDTCMCEVENVCSCKSCGCEANVSVTQCGCGNWQQCVIETQDSEGEQ